MHGWHGMSNWWFKAMLHLQGPSPWELGKHYKINYTTEYVIIWVWKGGILNFNGWNTDYPWSTNFPNFFSSCRPPGTGWFDGSISHNVFYNEGYAPFKKCAYHKPFALMTMFIIECMHKKSSDAHWFNHKGLGINTFSTWKISFAILCTLAPRFNTHNE